MELIRHTIEHIKSKSYGYNLLNKVKDEVKLVIDATPKYRATDRRHVLEANRKTLFVMRTITNIGICRGFVY